MRFRFEKASQVFGLEEGSILILPLKEVEKVNREKYKVFAELPSIIYPEDEERIKEELKKSGIKDVVCENIGAIEIANELGLVAHGGMFLNILNSEALDVYKDLGLVDATLSMELNFNEARQIKGAIPYGFVIYGYMPLMKFRSCPGDCNTCKGKSIIKDRLGEEFTLICRDKKYSELLNYVPTYVADRAIPKCDFTTLYFTKETKEEAEKIYRLAQDKLEYPGKRTAGLYFRELL